MSLRVLYDSQNKVTHIFGLIFLCVAYFYNFLVAEPLSIFFQISYFIGQVLVNKFLIFCKFTFEGVHLIYSLFQVLYEDSLIFVKDAAEKFTCAIDLFNCIYLCLYELGWICIGGICEIGQVITSAVGIVQNTFAIIKYGIHITGATIWRFLTYIPETVIFNIYAINSFIVNTCKELISSVFMFFDNILEWLVNIYFFFFDIPPDSVYGLVIGSVLATIIYIKFHNICVIISSGAVKFYKQIINFGSSLWTGRFLEKKTETNSSYETENDERLCIICQYHSKEIIIFPCKHLCLCEHCSLQLTKIRPSCPICRGAIRKTLKVYL